MVLAGTDGNWFLLPEEDKIPQHLQGHLQSGDLATTSSHNTHDNTLGKFQVSGTTRMTIKSL